MSDTIVLIVCACAAFFMLGMEVSKQEPTVKTCPVVENQKVISTMHDGNGHYCYYARFEGRATYKRKI